MNKKDKKISVMGILKNGGLFIALIAVTFYMLFRDNDIYSILKTILHINPFYIAIAAGCMCIFICCEALNIKRTLKMFGYKLHFFRCLKYALVGFFFSSITPSASGGQPMQVYYMHKDQIDISHSTLTLLIELASYQIVTVGMAMVSFIIQFKMFRQTIGRIQWLLFTGVTINIVILAVILGAIFSKSLIPKAVMLIARILKKFHYKKADHFQYVAHEQIKKYHSGAIYFQQHKLLMAKILLTNLVQITAVHSVPYWVYRSFGLSDFSVITVIALQAVLYITVSALPLPGAVGISESGFLILYKVLFPSQILSSAMLLSRGISFYLFVLISGIFISFFQFRTFFHRKDPKIKET